MIAPAPAPPHPQMASAPRTRINKHTHGYADGGKQRDAKSHVDSIEFRVRENGMPRMA
jgi:hypothetical protein